MRRLVFVTQAADPSHPALGATLPMIRALAARVDEVVVVAGRIGPEALPANCRAVSFAASSQSGRGVRYLGALVPEIVRRPLAVVAHMSPVFALLAAPFARPLRVPLLLWFTQQGSGPLLEVAERVVDVLLTVDERSVPLRSRKVRAIGHGIDVASLPCLPERAPPLRRLLGLGRYAPVKGWETVLQAVAELPETTLTIRGPVLTDRDRVHRPWLAQRARELGVADRVALEDEVGYGEVAGLLELADAVVNATHGNSADKVVYEAAAARLPVYAASPVFDSLLPPELRFDAGDAGMLAARIRDYRSGTAAGLRERVAAEHSVDHWAESVLELAGA